jgi:uncharacterized surface protein with fasciclin (FAS1) repeats
VTSRTGRSLLVGAASLLAACSLAETQVAPLEPTPAQAKAVEKLAVLDALGKARGFSTMIRLIRASGMDATLAGDGPWTVLAPNDDAFARLPEGTLDGLLLPENKESLVALVKNHLLEGSVDTEELRKRAKVESLAGNVLSIKAEGTRLRVEGALLEATDLDARNGIAHALDSVVMPKTSEPK